MFDSIDPAVLLQRMCSAARGGVRGRGAVGCDRRVGSAAIAQDGGASDDWVIDANDAVVLEVSAALGVPRGWAVSNVRYAYALRVQLPQLGRVFIAGDIDEPPSEPRCSGSG